MSTCPSPNQIQEFIENGSFTDEFSTHIDTCDHCVALVMQLCEQVADSKTIRMALADQSVESMLQADQEFLSRVAKAYPRQGLAGPTYRSDTIHNSAVSADTIRFPAPPTEVGSLGRIDSLHVISEIGSGGFGDVYLAFDERFNRKVALKILRTSVSEASYLARFKREAQSAGGIRHENVVMHLGMLEPTPSFPHACLILEYVSGGSLRDKIKSDQPCEVDQAVRWIIQAARGLAAVHNKEIIHRDVKPGNLLISEEGNIKLSDFGLARETSPESDISVRVAGTPPYMSPEQIQTPDQLSYQTDIYSLSVVLYEVLTGSRPFRGSDEALRRQIIHDQPTPLRQLNPQVPLDLETICLRALHKEPSRRFESANDFADDLQRWLDGRPIASRRIGRAEKAYMWARRSPALASLCVALFLTAALSLGAAIWINQLKTSEAQARLAADKNALEASKQRNLSLETMQIMVIDLGGRIGTHEALTALYPKVTEQLEELNSSEVATPESQYTLAISNLRTANIYLAFTLAIRLPDTLEKAKKHFERSESLLKGLPGDHRTDLMQVYDGLGSYLLNVGDLEAAQTRFQSELELGEELLRENANDAEIARSITVVHESLGKVNLERGKFPEGTEHYKTCLTLRERLADINKSSPQFKSDLGSVLCNYGIAIQPSDPATARAFYDRAVALYSELVESYPQNMMYMRGLALGYDLQGKRLASDQRMPFIRKALDIREKAHRIDPLDRNNLNGLIASELEVAEHTDDPVASRHNYDLALELSSNWAPKDKLDIRPLKFIGRVKLGYCRLQRSEMKLVEAKNFAVEAIEIRRKIVEQSSVAANITSLVVALKEVADIEQQLEEFKPAITNLDEAIERLEKLKNANELLPQYEGWIPELLNQREEVLRSIGGVGSANAQVESDPA